MTDYLTSPDWEPPALLRPTHAEQRSTETMQLVARAMVRGQGKTEGYYERTIPIKHKVKMAMLRRAEARELGDIAQTRIKWIRTVQRILSHAIQTFAARGDSDKISPEHRKLARPWLKQLDAIVDARFFDDLQIEEDTQLMKLLFDAPEVRPLPNPNAGKTLAQQSTKKEARGKYNETTSLTGDYDPEPKPATPD